MKERQVFRRTEEMSPPTLVGVSSLLVIFSVLCLAVFAMLSLSTVQMDRRLLGNTVNSVRERAEAEVKAQEILGRLRAGEVPEEAVQEADAVYSYSCPVTENASLKVRVRIDGTAYRILQWQEVPEVDWEPDESLELVEFD
jgi:hypothetical protein